MQPGGGQAEDNIPGLDGFAGDDFFALDYADDESGEIVFAVGIEAGHLSGLAANEGAAVVLAGVGETFDHFFGDALLEFANSEVVHEKHGRGALHSDVINAMINQVGADSVVHVHFKGELQLGAHAIHAGNQNRIEILGLVHRKQPAVAADLAEHTLGESFVREILDALLGAVSLVDVDASIGVGNRFGRLFRHSFRLLTLCGELLPISVA